MLGVDNGPECYNLLLTSEGPLAAKTQVSKNDSNIKLILLIIAVSMGFFLRIISIFMRFFLVSRRQGLVMIWMITMLMIITRIRLDNDNFNV